MNFVFLCIILVLIGYGIGYLILENSEISLLIQFKLTKFFNVNPNLSDNSSKDSKIFLKDDNKGTFTSYQCKTAPWDKLKIDGRLNIAIEEFLEALIENYVHNWYDLLIKYKGLKYKFIGINRK